MFRMKLMDVEHFVEKSMAALPNFLASQVDDFDSDAINLQKDFPIALSLVLSRA